MKKQHKYTNNDILIKSLLSILYTNQIGGKKNVDHQVLVASIPIKLK